MRRLRYDMRPIVALLVINLVITFSWSGIAWQAHIGGLAAGVVIGYAMVHAPRSGGRWCSTGPVRWSWVWSCCSHW